MCEYRVVFAHNVADKRSMSGPARIRLLIARVSVVLDFLCVHIVQLTEKHHNFEVIFYSVVARELRDSKADAL